MQQKWRDGGSVGLYPCTNVCIYQKWRDICGFTGTCSSSTHSQQVAQPERLLFKVALTFRQKSGEEGEERGGGRKWDGDATEGGRTEGEAGEKELSYSCSVGSALQNKNAGWQSEAKLAGGDGRVCVKECANKTTRQRDVFEGADIEPELSSHATLAECYLTPRRAHISSQLTRLTSIRPVLISDAEFCSFAAEECAFSQQE